MCVLRRTQSSAGGGEVVGQKDRKTVRQRQNKKKKKEGREIATTEQRRKTSGDIKRVYHITSSYCCGDAYSSKAVLRNSVFLCIRFLTTLYNLLTLDLCSPFQNMAV